MQPHSRDSRLRRKDDIDSTYACALHNIVYCLYLPIEKQHTPISVSALIAHIS